MRSLSRLMLVALLAVVAVAGAASSWLAYRAGVIEAGELFDAKLAHSARVLRGLVDASFSVAGSESTLPIEIAVWGGERSGEGPDLATATGHAYETKLAFQVWSGQGRLLLRSDNAPEVAISPLVSGFHDVLLGNERWRSFSLRAGSGRWYLVGEREDVRADIAGDIAEGILLPLLVELPVLGLLIWLVIRFGEGSLRRVIGEIEARARAENPQPISAERMPSEIAGLVDASNRLMAALDAALQREKRFTADAAHELRTPIAALRLQLSNLRQSSDDRAARQRAECQLELGLQRLGRLVEQLLTLSRLEPGAPMPTLQPVDLLPLAREAMAGLLNAGLGADIELELQAGQRPYLVSGDALSLDILLRNLIDNALRYTPRGGRVQVSLREQGDCIELGVEDSGPGIPEAARARVLERFHRELGSGVEGSGLGLSIVERVARLHAAQLDFDRSPTLGGLWVRVRLPALREPAALPGEAIRPS